MRRQDITIIRCLTELHWPLGWCGFLCVDIYFRFGGSSGRIAVNGTVPQLSLDLTVPKRFSKGSNDDGSAQSAWYA